MLGPKHTLESVAKQLVEGLTNGTLVLDGVGHTNCYCQKLWEYLRKDKAPGYDHSYAEMFHRDFICIACVAGLIEKNNELLRQQHENASRTTGTA